MGPGHGQWVSRGYSIDELTAHVLSEAAELIGLRVPALCRHIVRKSLRGIRLAEVTANRTNYAERSDLCLGDGRDEVCTSDVSPPSLARSTISVVQLSNTEV
jgi:hypothetical protein